MSAVLPRLLALAWLAWVLPGDRVVGLLAEARAGRGPLHIEASLSAHDSSAPVRLAIDLHPELGERVSDERGGRWLLAPGGRTASGTQAALPAWLPDLAPLALRREVDLRSWLAAEGIDPSRNELARCGDDDCWVLGTRQSPAQLWIGKYQLDVRRVVRPKLPSASFDQWQDFGKIRFPARIEIADGESPIATLRVESVSAASLGPSDFSPAWVQTPASPKAR